MAEFFGKGISVGSGFDLGANLPLDNRTIQATLADRDTMPTIQLVEGLLVYVKESKTTYVLKSFDADGSNRVWEPLSTGNVVEIINSLESTRTDAALSAAQGQVLKGLIDELKSSISAALNYKGTKATYEELPTTGNNKGDVWNVEAAHGTTPAGTNYAWDGLKWDPLGGTVDLSGYWTGEQVNTFVTGIADNLSKADEALGGRITTVSNNLANKVDKVDGAGLISDTALNQITTNKNDIASINTSLGNKQDTLKAGNAISISDDDTIDVKFDPNNNAALSKTADGLKLDLNGVKGTTVQLGEILNFPWLEYQWVDASSSIYEAFEETVNAVQAINPIKSLESTDESIMIGTKVGADDGSRDLRVNVASLVAENSAIQVVNGKLDIMWYEI